MQTYQVSNGRTVTIDTDHLDLPSLNNGQYDLDGVQPGHDPHVAAALYRGWHATVPGLALHTSDLDDDDPYDVLVIATQWGVPAARRLVRQIP